MLRAELGPRVEWAETLPGRTLPKGWMPLSVVMLEGLRVGVADGHALPHDRTLHVPIPEIPADKIQSADVTKAVGRMKEAIDREQERSRGAAAGLAANQIRLRARIAAMALGLDSNTGTERTMTFVANPSIVPIANPETGKFETVTASHGCVKSCLECWANIDDHQRVRFTGWNVTSAKPEWINEEVDGYTSAIIAHEIRHLDGLTSPDYGLAQNAKSLNPRDPDQFINGRPLALKYEFRESFDEDEAGDSWPYKIPRGQWMAIKNGSFLEHYLDIDR